MTTATSDALSPRCARPHHRAAITDHFAGRGSPAAEATLRAHLLGCVDCDAYYRRHLLLARLDPRALPARERLGRGLGLRGDRFAWRRTWVLGLCVPAVAAALLVLLPRYVLHGGVGTARSIGADGEFAARGPAGGVSSFWTYLVGADGTPRLAGKLIGRADEMAFAYANAAGKPFLMIFGVDEHRHVFWFHPGWSAGTPAPQALSATVGPGPYELPEAIRQPFDGARLRVYAAFSDRRFDATMIDNAVRSAGDGDPSRALGASGITVVERTFEVRP